MKFAITLSILFELLSKRHVTAAYLAEKYGISQRTVYRYVELLSTAVPVFVKRGRSGGICIPDNYKLPSGFLSKEEYDAAIRALDIAYAQSANEDFLAVKHKLTMQTKTDNRFLMLSGSVDSVMLDSSIWGDTDTFSDKIRLMEEGIQKKFILEIEYVTNQNEKMRTKIEPHMLVYRQNVWLIYAFCHALRDFRLFRIGHVVSILKTPQHFSPRPFKREDIPMPCWRRQRILEARLEVSEGAVAIAQEWLGIENMQYRDGKWYADASLPDDEALPRKIMALGENVRVLAPDTLRERIKNTAEKIGSLYC